jgi:hypothetical protein
VGIADSRAVEAQGWDLGRGLKKGVIRKFDRLEDLAAVYDIPLDEFQATIERYNGYVIRAQVINLDQEPVEGLYAAGEVTGGVHGACRLGSCAITECLIFGRIAGLNAASERGRE